MYVGGGSTTLARSNTKEMGGTVVGSMMMSANTQDKD